MSASYNYLTIAFSTLALLLLPTAYLLRKQFSRKPKIVLPPENVKEAVAKPITMMQPPKVDLAPPKDDPFTVEELKGYDGSDESKPILVAIKGVVFDVTHKKDVYGPGKSYNIFAGKDASRGLGKSSLKPEDAVADYSTLDEKDMKVLEDWYNFFLKRYNVVGKVVQISSSSSS